MYQGDYGFEMTFSCLDTSGNPLCFDEVLSAYLFIQRGDVDVLKKPMTIDYNLKSISYVVEQGVLSIGGITYTFQPKLYLVSGEITGTPIKEKIKITAEALCEGE